MEEKWRVDVDINSGKMMLVLPILLLETKPDLGTELLLLLLCNGLVQALWNFVVSFKINWKHCLLERSTCPSSGTISSFNFPVGTQ